MTYAEAIASVRANAFPEREARDLRTVNSAIILDGVIDLMRWVPRLRRRQFTLVQFAETRYKCGATYLDRPENGKVLRVYTYTQDSHCDAVYYTPVSRTDFDKAVKGRTSCGTDLPTPDLDDGIAESDASLGYVMAVASNNKGWRAANGIYTIVDDEIMLYPHIEDTENVAVEWRGSRKSFDDDDLVTWDRDILHSLELWTRWKTALRHTCDEKDYLAFGAEYRALRAQIVLEDQDNERMDEDEIPYECCSPYQLSTADETTAGEDTDDGGESEVLASRLLTWAMGENYEFLERTYDETNVIISGTVRWPDLSTGTYTRTYKNEIWNVVDGYTITHDNSGAIVTQAQVTRDANGNITTKPALTVSGYTFVEEGDTGTAESAVIAVFLTVADFQAETVAAQEVTIISDDQGDTGKFFRDASSTAAHDGVTTIIDAAGVRFTRFTAI